MIGDEKESGRDLAENFGLHVDDYSPFGGRYEEARTGTGEKRKRRQPSAFFAALSLMT
jgi:hypothetical protein